MGEIIRLNEESSRKFIDAMSAPLSEIQKETLRRSEGVYEKHMKKARRGDSLGDRIKRYEDVYNSKLTPRSCLFIRIDGKSFHTWTKSMERPFDQRIIDAMVGAAHETAKQMSGFKLAYIQSDEVTFMLTDFDELTTQGWFGYEVNKVVSISASLFTAHFNKLVADLDKPVALFDSRAFIVPVDDAPNVFLWRYQDWLRNSVQMLGRSVFSHKELEYMSAVKVREMLKDNDVDWDELDARLKYGTFIDRWGMEFSLPVGYYDIKDLAKI